MPKEVSIIISRLEKLRDDLLTRISKINRINKGSISTEEIQASEIWGKLKDFVQDITFLNNAIDIAEGKIEANDPDVTNIVRQRLEQDKQQLKNKLRGVKRYENAANEELASPLPDPAKDEQQPEEKPKNPAKKPTKNPQAEQEVKPQQIKKIATDRTKLVDDIISEMEQQVGKAQEELLRTIVENFVDKLEVDEDGNIKNTLANKRKVSLLDNVYQKFVQESGVTIVETIVKGVSKVLDFNGRYYGMFTTQAKLGDIMVETRDTIGDWLGITKRGALVENGYLNRLLSDPTIRNTVRDGAFKSIVSQKGFFQVKSDLKNYIAGNKLQAGALQKYYRNFVFDIFSQVDRTQSKIFADKLKFNYAIYEGGIIKTTRSFCRARNGKVFSREEIAAFDPKEARPPNYNPFTDLGGYGCRHHLNWVPDAVAFALRPELKKAA
jgi:hypothetical protein